MHIFECATCSLRENNTTSTIYVMKKRRKVYLDHIFGVKKNVSNGLANRIEALEANEAIGNISENGWAFIEKLRPEHD